MKQITEAAGIGRCTLYWYFKSKDEILETILRKWDREFVDGLMGAVHNCSGDFVAKYKAFHRFTVLYVCDNRELSLAFHTVMSEIAGTDTEAERITKEIWERYRLFLEGMLEDGKREGSVDANATTAIYAHIIMASLTGILVQWLVSGDSLGVRAFQRTFRDLLLKGMTGRKR